MHYHRLSVLVIAPLVCLARSIAPLWDDMLVKHTWNAVPPKWESLGPPEVSTTIDLHLALKPHRENALIDALYQVSDPERSTYGAHLTKEQAAELVAPHPDTLELVHSWLEHHDLSSSSISMTHGGGWLTVTGVPVSKADDLLGASYQIYRHTDTNETILRTVGYGLPAALHEHVQTVAPTTYFAPPRTLQQAPRKSSREETVAMANANATPGELTTVLSRRNAPFTVTPGLLSWLYKTAGYVPAAKGQNAVGIVGFTDQSPIQADLTTFMTEYRIDVEDATFTVVPINGGKYDASHPTDEASMNIQYSEAIAYPAPHFFYSIGGNIIWLPSSKEPSPGDTYLEWFRYLFNLPKIPQTINISYGNEEYLFAREYAIALCNLFGLLGLHGVSVLVASGDDGVGKGNCKESTGKTQFEPNFPASCPWVTAVGGTTSHTPEIAASLSGGGFSSHFRRPSYQDGAVSAFLEQLGTEKHAGLYDPGGRGIPDIAAQALGFEVFVGGRQVIVEGTSCAAPTVTGMISLLNDFLVSSGRDPLGILNPWLYGRGRGGLKDIITGSNPGCDTEGFSAIEGWDPVTGLGTLNFEELLRVLDNAMITD